jgi:hypothetical protein
MKLSENQKNGFYIALTVFLGVCFGIVVFFIVKHFRNNNSNNNCPDKCNGINCGDGCSACTSTCPSGSCIGGSCSGGYTCLDKCNGINCGDGCSACTGTCPSGSCIGGSCKADPNPDCYAAGQDPFGTPPGPCDIGKKLKCCDGTSFCLADNGKGYICKDTATVKTTDRCDKNKNVPLPTCSSLPKCLGSRQFCPNPSNEKEPYFFNATSNQYTYTCDNALNLELGTSMPDTTLATDTQVMAEFDLPVDGLDSCNLGWTVDAIGRCRMLNPYKTARGDTGSGSGCTFIPSDPYRPNGVKSPEYNLDKGGLWLYGVKPNLPDCNSTVPAGAKFCVGKYNPNKISKYSKP